MNLGCLVVGVVLFIALDKSHTADDEKSPDDANGEEHSDDTGDSHNSEWWGLIVKFIGIGVFVEITGSKDDDGEEEGNQDDPADGEDGTGFAVEQAYDLAALLDKDILIQPGAEDGDEDGGGDPAYDEAEAARKLDAGAELDFLDTILSAPYAVEHREE